MNPVAQGSIVLLSHPHLIQNLKYVLHESIKNFRIIL